MWWDRSNSSSPLRVDAASVLRASSADLRFVFKFCRALVESAAAAAMSNMSSRFTDFSLFSSSRDIGWELGSEALAGSPT